MQALGGSARAAETYEQGSLDAMGASPADADEREFATDGMTLWQDSWNTPLMTLNPAVRLTALYETGLETAPKSGPEYYVALEAPRRGALRQATAR